MSYFAPPKNKVSTTSFNSRDSATLAAGATFQGVSEDVVAYGRAAVSIYSTTATAAGFLTFEVSQDNVIWSGLPKTWQTSDAPLMWNIVERYFRIKYVNNGVEAADFSIQTQYSTNADVVLSHQISEALPAHTSAQAVRSTNNFDLDTAREHLRGQLSFFFFGFNDGVKGGFEDVHPSGGDIAWQTTAQSIEILSTSAADNGTTPGLGLQSVEVHGLSATGAEQSETILTNGTTAVAGVLTYIRINNVHSLTSGTYGGSHQGDIICQVASGGAILSKMTGIEGLVNSSPKYGSGEAGNGYYTVPLGKALYITRLQVTPDSASNKSMDVVLYQRGGILDTSTPFSPRIIIWKERGALRALTKDFKTHIRVKSLTDVWFRARTTTGGTSSGAESILGTADTFAIFTSSGAVSNTGTITIEGDVGTELGSVTGIVAGNVDGKIQVQNPITDTAKTDLATGYTALNAMSGTSAHAAAFGAGEVLGPNVYTTTGVGSIGGVLTLDGGGDPLSIFVFKINGTLTTSAGVSIELIGDARAENIYWVSQGAMSFGATNDLVGRFIANNAAVTVGATLGINGGLYSTAGAITTAGGNVVAAFNVPSLIEVSLDFYLVDADATET